MYHVEMLNMYQVSGNVEYLTSGNVEYVLVEMLNLYQMEVLNKTVLDFVPSGDVEYEYQVEMLCLYCLKVLNMCQVVSAGMCWYVGDRLGLCIFGW